MACRRPLNKAAYTAPSGWMLGPKCAAAVGKAQPKTRRKARAALVAVVAVLDGQKELFE